MLPVLEAPDFVAGTVARLGAPARRGLDDAVVRAQPGGRGLHPRGRRERADADRLRLAELGEDAEAIALHGDRAVLAEATPEQLAMLLTALIREDRFNEGALGDSFESGIMTAIARRAKELVDLDA